MPEIPAPPADMASYAAGATGEQHGDDTITVLLARWRDGEEAAGDAIASEFYPILRRMAQRELLVSGGRLTLQATELANEAYVRLLQQRNGWENRCHLMAIVARTLRRTVVDLLRKRLAEKRGADCAVIALDATEAQAIRSEETVIGWLQLDEALILLERRDPTAARIVELRYFGGLNNDEIARALGIGVATVVRHWQFARAWLHSRLQD